MFPPVLLHVFNQQDRVVHHDARQQDHPQQHRRRQRRTGNPQRHPHTYQRERNGQQDDQRVEHALVLQRQHHEHQEHRQQGDDRQLAVVLLNGFLFATQYDAVTIRHLEAGQPGPHRVVDLSYRGHFGNHITAQPQDPILVLPPDLPRAQRSHYIGHVAQVDRIAGAGPRKESDVAQLVRSLEPFPRQPHPHVILAIPFGIPRSDGAVERGADCLAYLRNAQPQIAGPLAVESNGELGTRLLGGGLEVFQSGNALEPSQHGLADGLELGQFVTLNVDRHVGTGDRGAKAADPGRPYEDLGSREPALIDSCLELAHPFVGRHVAIRSRHQPDIHRAPARPVRRGAAEEKSAGGGEEILHVRHLTHDPLEFQRHGVGLLRRAAGRQPDVRAHTTIIHLGQELAAEVAGGQQRQRERRDRTAQHNPAVGQAASGRLAIELAGAVHAVVEGAGRPRLAELAGEPDLGQLGREHWHQRQRNGERGEDRERDGEDQFLEDQRRQSADQKERNYSCEISSCRCYYCRCYFTGACMCRFFRVFDALVALPEDILQHHDGVVDQHADAQRQTPERHDVEGQLAQSHQHEGGEHCQRDGQADDQCLAQRLQEHQHHDHREDGPEQRGIAHRVDRVTDEAGLVLDHPVFDVARDKPIIGQDLKLFIHIVGHAHGVGVGLLPERDLDGGNPVEPGPEPLLLVRVLDDRDIGEGYPPPAPHIEQHRADVFHAAELARSLAHQLALQRPHSSSGNVLVLGPQRTDDLRHRDAVGLQAFLVQDHTNLAHQSAGDVHRRHPRHGQQLRTQPILDPGAQRDQVARG